MNFQFNFDPTKRRRSNLGRRNRVNNNGESRPAVVTRPTLLTAPSPHFGSSGRKIGRLAFDKPSREFQRKKLFTNSGSAFKSRTSSFNFSRAPENSPNDSCGSYSALADATLNVTGVQPFVPNSPRDFGLSPPLSKSSSVKAKLAFEQLEAPKSPGISEYDKFLRRNLNKIKPPVDPDDEVEDRIQNLKINKPFEYNVDNSLRHDSYHSKLKPSPVMPSSSRSKTSPYSMNSVPVYSKLKVSPLLTSSSLAAKPKTSPSQSSSIVSHALPKASPTISLCSNTFDLKFSPHLSSTYMENVVKPPCESSPSSSTMKSDCPSVSGSAKKLSIINETGENTDPNEETDLNSTDSFELTERTMIAQMDDIFKVPTVKKVPKSVKKHEEQCDDEAQLIMSIIKRNKEIQEELSAQNCILQKLLDKRIPKAEENKENCPTTTSKSEKKWIKDMKSGNPNLLKTPKQTRDSLVGKKTWTPHSLSMVINSQMDELFDE